MLTEPRARDTEGISGSILDGNQRYTVGAFPGTRTTPPHACTSFAASRRRGPSAGGASGANPTASRRGRRSAVPETASRQQRKPPAARLACPARAVRATRAAVPGEWPLIRIRTGLWGRSGLPPPASLTRGPSGVVGRRDVAQRRVAAAHGEARVRVRVSGSSAAPRPTRVAALVAGALGARGGGGRRAAEDPAGQGDGGWFGCSLLRREGDGRVR